MKTDKTDKMKNKEEILISHVGKLAVAGLKWKSLDDRKKLIFEAMQEHTDQAIAAYKLKLKEEIDLYESTGAPLIKEVIYSIIDNLNA